MERLERGILTASIVLSFFFLCPLRGVTPGKQSLNELAMFPKLAVQLGYWMDDDRGFVPVDQERDIPQEIAELQKKLKSEPDNPKTWAKLGECYRISNNNAAAKFSDQKTLELLRVQEKSRGEDGLLLADLGEALMSSLQFEEAETILRKAITVDPKKWRCWTAWGSFRLNQSFRVLSPEDPFPTSILGKAFHNQLARPTAGQLEQSQKLMDEASQSFEKAIKLAPKEPAVYRAHSAFSNDRPILEALFRFWKGGVELPTSIQLLGMKESLPDYRKIVELSPHDLKFQIRLFFFEATVAAIGDAKAGDLQPQTKDLIHEAVIKLEKLSHNPDKSIEAEAFEVLAQIQFMLLNDPPTAKASAGHAVDLDPTRALAWNVLISLLITPEKYHELVSVTEARLKTKESCRNHILAAKAHDRLGTKEKVKQHIEKALQLDPDDFDANIAGAALSMREGSDSSLKSATNYLSKASLAIGEWDSAYEYRWLSYSFNRALLMALSGDKEGARKDFQEILATDKDFEPAKKALAKLDE